MSSPLSTSITYDALKELHELKLNLEGSTISKRTFNNKIDYVIACLKIIRTREI